MRSTPEITGTYLKIHDNAGGEGVFFVSQSGEAESRVEQIRTNEPCVLP